MAVPLLVRVVPAVVLAVAHFFRGPQALAVVAEELTFARCRSGLKLVVVPLAVADQLAGQADVAFRQSAPDDDGLRC